MAATTPMARMDQLDKVEKEVVSCLHTAGMALSEVAKDKPSQKQVSTGQPHEGSSYASQKVLQMAWHRLEHARSRVSELDRIKTQHVSRFISPAQRAALLQQQQQQGGDRAQQQQGQGGS
eukprot:GFUD01071618.1.p2 GENE.GFUD01071618.1~~GFUD01071618.1.p2  ORF type:complete len:120 (+),score=51.39 GFUD01071618.1:54-413(+)